jgi:hypothetical protein
MTKLKLSRKINVTIEKRNGATTTNGGTHTKDQFSENVSSIGVSSRE